MMPGALLAEPLRVIEDSDTAFEIENRPTRRAAITVAAILLAVAMGLAALADGAIGTGLITVGTAALIGGLILMETVTLTQLRFDRSTGLVRLRQTSLRGQTEETLALAALERVEPRMRYAPRNGRSSVELYLVQKTDDGQHDTLIPMARSNPEDVNRMAALITSWLSSMRKDSLT